MDGDTPDPASGAFVPLRLSSVLPTAGVVAALTFALELGVFQSSGPDAIALAGLGAVVFLAGVALIEAIRRRRSRRQSESASETVPGRRRD